MRQCEATIFSKLLQIGGTVCAERNNFFGSLRGHFPNYTRLAACWNSEMHGERAGHVRKTGKEATANKMGKLMEGRNRNTGRRQVPGRHHQGGDPQRLAFIRGDLVVSLLQAARYPRLSAGRNIFGRWAINVPLVAG